MLLGVTLRLYTVVASKKSNKFYCVQAAKTIKSKYCQGSNLADSDQQF